MNFKTSFSVLILFLIFLNLSIVCAGSNDNLTVVEPSFDEFNDVDVIYAGDVVEINRYFRESIFFYGEVGDSLFIAKIKDKSGNVVGAGENVTFNINGVFYTRVTNETGYVNFRISLFPEEYINYYNV